MKILSIAVPCYNSEAYMEKCIDSLLVGGEEVEILIVDDGSKDGTTEIADRYQEKYPTIVKAIHQENKGHGGAVNTGVENATGLYFKVVDSDDWVNPEAYQKILNVLAEVVRGPKTLDLLISNYVYEKEGTIFLKPHPRDLLDYQKLFAEYPQFDASMPMEMLNFFPNLRFKKVVTIFTEVKGLPFADEAVRLGPDFMDAYEDPLIHRQNEQI